MNRRFFISVAFILAALSLANCQHEPAVQPVAEADKTIPSYHVPREKALAELNSFLADVDANNTTRGGKIRQIKDVTPILGDKFQNATRVSEDEAAAAIDTLLYLVNFEDEDGYAVLSAVDFLAPIIALMDEGNADSTLLGVIGHPIDPDNVLEIGVDDCCIDYYEDELEEEAADTTDLPIFAPVDSLIWGGGLLSHSHDVTRANENSSSINHSLKFVLRMVNDYCEFKLIDHNNPAGSGDNSGGNTGGSGNDGSGNNTGDDSGDNGGSTSPQDWAIIGQIQPMLKTSWEQGTPFNTYCPTKNGVPTVAGCTVVALGQVIAYHKHPKQVHTGYNPNWDLISKVTIDTREDSILVAAYWLAELGEKYIKADYGTESTSASMYKVKKAMKELKYLNVDKFCGYRESTIISHLNTDRPFLISATSPKKESGDGENHGHAWVIDGYIQRARNDQVETMMHCNMGWGGLYDGYYASGIFDTTKITDENGETIDRIAADSTKRKYCKYYRSVTYDKPLTF